MTNTASPKATTTPIKEDVPEFVQFCEYIPELRLALCRNCPKLLSLRQLRAHCIEEGHTKDYADRIVDSLHETKPDIIRRMDDALMPDSVKQPIPHLLIETGFRCSHVEANGEMCKYTALSEQSVKSHASKRGHPNYGLPDVSNPALRALMSRNRRVTKPSSRCQKVSLHKLYAQGRHWVCVLIEGTEDDPAQPHQANDGDDDVPGAGACVKEPAQLSPRDQHLLSDAERRFDDAQALMKAKEERPDAPIRPAGPMQVNSWMERTRWPTMYEGKRTAELLELVEKPTKSEPLAWTLWHAMKDVFLACHAFIKRCPNQFLLEEVMRTQSGCVNVHRLRAYQETSNLTHHIHPWRQVLVLLARTQEEGYADDWPVRLSKSQRRRWDAVVSLAHQAASVSNTTRDKKPSVRGNQKPPRNAVDEVLLLPALQAACVDLCVSLLEEAHVGVTEGSNSLTSPFLYAIGILGLDEQSGHITISKYTSILSSLIKVGRFMVVARAVRLDPSNAVLKLREMVDQFMLIGTHSPMSWMQMVRMYGMGISRDMITDGLIVWHGVYTISYKKWELDVRRLRDAAQELVVRARVALLRIAFAERVEELPKIPWSTIKDTPSRREHALDFARQSPDMHDAQRSFMKDRVYREQPEIGAALATPEGRESFLDAHEEFLEILLVLVHLTYGFPGRATEVLSMFLANCNVNGAAVMRNVFVVDEEVVFMTLYHKSYSVTGAERPIYRFVPREVGELFVWYSWLVRPFLEVLLSANLGQRHEKSYLIWRPRRTDKDASVEEQTWKTERMSGAMVKHLGALTGCPLTLAPYRQMSKAIGRRFLGNLGALALDDDPNEYDEDCLHHGDDCEEEQPVQTVFDAQMGHLTRTALRDYGNTMLALSNCDVKKRAQLRQQSSQWHGLLGFRRGGGGGNKHIPAELSSRLSSAPSDGATPAQLFQEALKKQARMADPLQALRAMRGDREASFLNENQKTALEACLANHDTIFYFAPTSAGKSAVYQVPAHAVPGGLTVVVVPYKSIGDEAAATCRSLGIRAHHWDDEQQGASAAHSASVVFAIPERLQDPAFEAWMAEERAGGRLQRVVLDECHLYLANSPDRAYRPSFCGVVQRAMSYGAQMLFLTATITAREQAMLLELLGRPASGVTIIHSPAWQPNMEYSVIDIDSLNGVDPQSVESVVDNVICPLLKVGTGEVSRKGEPDTLPTAAGTEAEKPGGKSVIFSFAIATVEEVARLLEERLGRKVYTCHSRMTKEERAEAMRAFDEDPEGILSASIILLHGVNLKGVQNVLNFGSPPRVSPYFQGAGRAGRGGIPGRAVLLVGRAFNFPSHEADSVELQQMQDYVQLGGAFTCRRVVLARLYDRVGEGCTEGPMRSGRCPLEWVPCDVCKPGRAAELEEAAQMEEAAAASASDCKHIGGDVEDTKDGNLLRGEAELVQAMDSNKCLRELAATALGEGMSDPTESTTAITPVRQSTRLCAQTTHQVAVSEEASLDQVQRSSPGTIDASTAPSQARASIPAVDDAVECKARSLDQVQPSSPSSPDPQSAPPDRRANARASTSSMASGDTTADQVQPTSSSTHVCRSCGASQSHPSELSVDQGLLTPDSAHNTDVSLPRGAGKQLRKRPARSRSPSPVRLPPPLRRGATSSDSDAVGDAAKGRSNAIAMDIAQFTSAVAAQLYFWHSRCVYCFFSSDPGLRRRWQRHRSSDCAVPDHQAQLRRAILFKRALSSAKAGRPYKLYSPRGYCYKCSVPQFLTPDCRAAGGGTKGTSCLYPDVVIPITYFLWQRMSDVDRDLMHRRMSSRGYNFESGSDEALYDWFTSVGHAGLILRGHVEVSGLLYSFYLLNSSFQSVTGVPMPSIEQGAPTPDSTPGSPLPY